MSQKKNVFIPMYYSEKTWDDCTRIFFMDNHFFAGKNDSLVESIEMELLQEERIRHLSVPEVESIMKEVIDICGPLLNKYQEEEFPIWFWSNIMERWLKHVIFSIFDKWERIQYVYKHFDDEEINIQEIKNEVVIPLDYEEFYGDLLGGDNHYLSCYRLLLDNDYKIRQHKFQLGEKNVHTPFTKISNLYSKIKNAYKYNGTVDKLVKHVVLYLKRKCSNFLYRGKAKIIFCGVDFPPEMINELNVVSNQKIQACDCELISQEYTIDIEFREKLKRVLCDKLDADNYHGKKIAEVLPYLIPFCYIENFKKMIENIPKKMLAKSVTAIFTGTGLYGTSISFAAMVAKARNGTRVMAMQHGGNYGLVKDVAEFDYHWDDVFYVWGKWDLPKTVEGCKLINAPSTKFCRYKNTVTDSVGKGILFVGTSIFLHIGYQHYKHNGCVDQLRYINYQKDIFSQLSSECRSVVTVRNYYVEYGWNVNEKLKRSFPDLYFEEGYNSRMFPQALQTCNMLIVDHISTTFIEALYIDKPFIIITCLDDYAFEHEEQPYVDMLVNVGVIRDLDTVAEINTIYKDVDKWWNEPERKKAVAIFRDRYLSNQDMSVGEIVQWWWRELSRIMENGKRNV